MDKHKILFLLVENVNTKYRQRKNKKKKQT